MSAREIIDESFLQVPKSFVEAIDIYQKQNTKHKVDKAYQGYERCFKNDICVGCPYRDLLYNEENVIVYPLACMKALMRDINQCIKEGKLVTEVLGDKPYHVCLRKVYEKADQ